MGLDWSATRKKVPGTIWCIQAVAGPPRDGAVRASKPFQASCHPKSPHAGRSGAVQTFGCDVPSMLASHAPKTAYHPLELLTRRGASPAEIAQRLGITVE
jgi:hypothetical protein